MMLLPLLPLTLAEKLANQLLHADPASSARLQALRGKRLRLTLRELPQPLTLTVVDDGVVFAVHDDNDVDCHIQTALAVLPELRDSANITRLIKADALDIEGDPMLAQRFSALFRDLDIDWQATLASRIGELPAYWLIKRWRQSRRWLTRRMAEQRDWLRDTVVEEKQLLVSAVEFAVFSDDLQALRARLDRLQRRLDSLPAEG
ncbi:ubiquinone biosynthesis accessory factor UbiJ [Idiomarina xiamenensis]|uniref:Ubiquinone biosynthesis accessory factor UbiJ n=1 Tax=Idiomarina xiamenensis 10-D-4 TaxID=740709 RepID=K2K9J4_9GAMM|nr:SCP2 sterol-binding domain-containing protein [Idiomarina xiamenensis]EKE84468.1 hypothetical protein A10D4_05352 [Idiomarina xiamenensis 10-D-4]